MIPRRKALTILAGAAALPFVGTARAMTRTQQWKGIALGAEARIVLDHPEADQILPRAVAEIRRLEKIFSLYLPNSELTQLNAKGVLSAPSFEMVELLSACGRMNSVTNGAFDPTVQNLWTLYARQAVLDQYPSDSQIADALDLTGWKNVRFSSQKVWVEQAGVKLSFNGIAQGFIADKVGDLLRREGVINVLVNTGEISALGTAPDGNPWRVSTAGPQPHDFNLTNGAVATSAPLGTVLGANGAVGHILDPRSGRPGGRWTEVTVLADTATEADALSTGFCLMTRAEIKASQGGRKVILS